jgi:outer membrane lipoprotein SlyB
MKTRILTMASLAMAASLNAGSIDGNAVLGSMVGAGVGSAVGSSIGGKEGAIIGGGAGGALGAAVGSSKTSTPARTTNTTVVNEKVIYVDRDRDYHDNGKHKGHDKHREGHDRD